MSTAATLAAVETAVVLGKKAVKAYQKGNKAGRAHLARKELQHEKDLDGNGRIGSVGGKHRRKR